jgi:hypothetical protein
MRWNWRLTAAAIAALLLALAYLAPYGSTNQATYLLDPLHRAMPELFHRDWFVSETPPYLPVFGWITQWFYVVDPEGNLAFAIAQVVVMLASYAAIYAIVRAVEGGWRAFIIIASFVTVSKGLSMGGSYLLVGYLQPSSLATLGWLVAIAALVSDRYLACGIAAAAGGALHANYLVLGIGLFTLAALARRDVSLRDHARILVPQLVVLAAFAPSLFGAAGVDDQALWILTHFHAPVHYAPGRLIRWIPPLVAWQAGAYAALYLLDHGPRARVLWRFSLVAFGIVAASALAIRFAGLESLTQVRWSRIGPFGELACKVLVAVALVRQAVRPKAMSPRTRVLVVLAMLAPMYETGVHLFALTPWTAIAVGSLLVVLVLGPWPRAARIALTALVLAAFAFALWASPRGDGLRTPINAPDDELALSRWVRAETPVDALFLAPPGEYRFRLLARRAVIVDTKSPPLQPDLLLAWYRRLCAMTLYPEAPTFEAVENRYGELTAAQLEEVARRFRADYIVVTAPTAFTEAPVFANASYRVFRLRRQELPGGV